MIGRDVYSSGRYVSHFQPDRAGNPFRALYARKRADIIAAVKATVPPGGQILDLGGGPGRMAVPLAEDYQVTLCDVSEDMLEIAWRSAASCRVPVRNLALLRHDANLPLPLEDASFDCALCIDLLPHVGAPSATLSEVRRVLKPGGGLLVDASNRSPWWLLRYPRALGRRPKRWWSIWRAGGVLPEWQQNVRHDSYAEFCELLSSSGLRLVEEWRYGPSLCPKWFLARCRTA